VRRQNRRYSQAVADYTRLSAAHAAGRAGHGRAAGLQNLGL